MKKKNLKRFNRAAKKLLQKPCLSCRYKSSCPHSIGGETSSLGFPCPLWLERPFMESMQDFMEMAFPEINWSGKLKNVDLDAEAKEAFASAEKIMGELK